MGYSGLDKVTDSDAASDLAYACQKAFLMKLCSGMNERHSEFNTSGPINVELIIEEGLLDGFDSDILEDFIWDVLLQNLDKEIASCGKDQKEQWGDEPNRLWHEKSFKRIKQSVIKFMKKKGISIENE